MDKLQNSVVCMEAQIKERERERENVDNQIQQYRTESIQLQERLIREGNAISLEELKNKRIACCIKREGQETKNQLRDMLDIAPLRFLVNYLLI